jgi:hypothetical protein
MTKQVRIENADTTPYKVIVEIWEKGAELPDGLGGFNQTPDTLVRTISLNRPTDMTGDGVYVTNTRYLVVKEAPAGP